MLVKDVGQRRCKNMQENIRSYIGRFRYK